MSLHHTWCFDIQMFELDLRYGRITELKGESTSRSPFEYEYEYECREYYTANSSKVNTYCIITGLCTNNARDTELHSIENCLVRSLR